MSSEVSIIKSKQLSTITGDLTQAHQVNTTSHDRCLAVGQQLLDLANQGMTDGLDAQIATFITKSRATVKKLYNNRSAYTQLFDLVKSEFAALEKDVDPTQKESIPYLLQQKRNEYAAYKRAEAERIRREEGRKLMLEREKATYESGITEEYRRYFDSCLRKQVLSIDRMFTDATLENIDNLQTTLQNYPTNLIDLQLSKIAIPTMLDETTKAEINNRVVNTLLPAFREQWSFEISSNVTEYLEKIPSKKLQLQVAAQASAEEAERIKEDMRKREEADRLRREAEKQASQPVEIVKPADNINALFDAAKIATPAYQPKTSVKQEIVINDSVGILEVLNLWWQHEGCKADLEKLKKDFKKQITFCEKLATKENIKIHSKSVSYIENVTAK